MLKWQWWVKDDRNWCKTSWKYIIFGYHKNQRIKFMRK